MSRSQFQSLAAELAAIGRCFDACGWVRGTSGNFSGVASRDPLRLAVTPSGASKGTLTAEQMIEVDAHAQPVNGDQRRPSAETLLHVRLAQRQQAGAVLHTHSTWSTMLSDLHGPDGGLAIEGYEMLKGLHGVASHEHREWLPIVENDQDMGRLWDAMVRALDQHPTAHGVLIRRHGLYTWGTNVEQAFRHVEILEFLLETVGQTRVARGILPVEFE